ncbi:MAG: hypothetical protein GC151_17730 [Betaproteobacteria bacterium]|nr:hypothetical protein [Betaproteobacteria bacterium]
MTLLDAALENLRRYGVTAAAQPFGRVRHDAAADVRVRIGYGGHEVTYRVELKRGLRRQALGTLIHQLEPHGRQGLLVADYVTPPLADELREHGIQFIDAAGNAYLDQPPLLVWIKGEKSAAAMPAREPTGRAFQPSGLQVIFALICRPEWVTLRYRELARRAGVAHGTVGWVMTELAGLGFVTEMRGQRIVVQRERLLQQWAEFYPRLLRPRLLLGRFRAETLEWWNTLDPTAYGAVLGGELAGGRLTKYLRPGTATFYTPGIAPKLLLDLKLRTDPAGNVEIYRKFWTFDAADAALAPEPLVYADLMATGDGRCIETARMIFEKMFADHD